MKFENRFNFRAFKGHCYKDPEGTDDGAGGGGTGGGSGGADDKTGANDTISRAELDKVIAEREKFRKDAKTLRDAQETERTAKMKEQNQWKEIAEANEKKAKEADERSERFQKSFLEDKKINTVSAACEKLGLRPEAMSDLEALDFADVTVETTSTGKINILGADKFAERLKTLKPHWFADKADPRVNPGTTRVRDTKGAITAQQLVDADRAARKSGDFSEYQKMHAQYQKQRTGGR